MTYFCWSGNIQNMRCNSTTLEVILYDFWSWISSNTKKLSLRKFVSPSVNLSEDLKQ